MSTARKYRTIRDLNLGEDDEPLQAGIAEGYDAGYKPIASPPPTSIEYGLQEQMADYAHRSWSSWMRYMFSKGAVQADGTLVLPAKSVARWQRQMALPYAELPEHEKETDRQEAREMIDIIIG